MFLGFQSQKQMSSQLRVCSHQRWGTAKSPGFGSRERNMKSSVQALCMSVVFEQLREPIQVETGGFWKQWFFAQDDECGAWKMRAACLFIHDRMPRVTVKQTTCRSKMIKYENLPVHAADHSNLAQRFHAVIAVQKCSRVQRWGLRRVRNTATPCWKWHTCSEQSWELLGFSWIPVGCRWRDPYFSKIQIGKMACLR